MSRLIRLLKTFFEGVMDDTYNIQRLEQHRRVIQDGHPFELCECEEKFHVVLPADPPAGPPADPSVDEVDGLRHTYSIYSCADKKTARKKLKKFNTTIGPLIENLTDDEKLLKLITNSPNLLRDHEGWTSAHLAANLNLAECLKEECVSVTNCKNDVDKERRTPLMVAVMNGKRESVEQLLNLNAQLSKKDKDGKTVFHHLLEKTDMIEPFFGANRPEVQDGLNIANNDGKTPFQLAVDKSDIGFAVKLLIAGADANRGLRLAIEKNNIDLIKMAIVVGADVNKLYDGKHTPLELVEQLDKPNKEDIKKILTAVGAKTDQSGKDTKDSSNEPASKRQKTLEDDESSTSLSGDRVLCLDGGGIKGLVLIQLLRAIETRTGKRIKDCFDWISGTSIGGILALMMAKGKSIWTLMGLLFEMKEKVFCKGVLASEGVVWSATYDAVQLEDLLTRYCGQDDVVMADIPSPPRVIIMAVDGKCRPLKLRMFRNYPVSDKIIKVQSDFNDDDYYYFGDDVPDNTIKKNHDTLVTYKNTLNIPLWKAGRATSAAPHYFPQMEVNETDQDVTDQGNKPPTEFIDGGMIANNPTLDTLTEIFKFKYAEEQDQQQSSPVKVVVSLGTGHESPTDDNECFSIGLKVAKHPVQFFLDLVSMITETNQQFVERAAAWCHSKNIKYKRFSPLIDHIEMDCTDNSEVINMMFKAQVHVYHNRKRFDQLCSLLKRPQSGLQSPSEQPQKLPTKNEYDTLRNCRKRQR